MATPFYRQLRPPSRSNCTIERQRLNDQVSALKSRSSRLGGFAQQMREVGDCGERMMSDDVDRGLWLAEIRPMAIGYAGGWVKGPAGSKDWSRHLSCPDVTMPRPTPSADTKSWANGIFSSDILSVIYRSALLLVVLGSWFLRWLRFDSLPSNRTLYPFAGYGPRMTSCGSTQHGCTPLVAVMQLGVADCY